jgi:hypothetical protein
VSHQGIGEEQLLRETRRVFGWVTAAQWISGALGCDQVAAMVRSRPAPHIRGSRGTFVGARVLHDLEHVGFLEEVIGDGGEFDFDHVVVRMPGEPRDVVAGGIEPSSHGSWASKARRDASAFSTTWWSSSTGCLSASEALTTWVTAAPTPGAAGRDSTSWVVDEDWLCLRVPAWRIVEVDLEVSVLLCDL